MVNKKHPTRSRIPLAVTLIIASFVSAILLASFSNRGSEYWVVTHDVTVGHQLVIGDLKSSHVDLATSAGLYIPVKESPLGKVATAKFQAGQLLSRANISSSNRHNATSAVPISIRATDVAAGIVEGEQVDIYWVIDSQNGEFPTEPVMILGGITLLSLDEKSKNFGSDASLTVAVEETQVLHLLQATTHGRLVVVRADV